MEPPELYLDAAATTPPLPAVIAAMQQLQQTAWANPSSLHGAGLAAAEALERARWRIAERFAVNPDQLIVTSGATESVHLALLGRAAGLVPGRLVISAVEHPAVVAAAHQLEALGCNQGNQSGWRGQQPIELLEPQYALPINGPFSNAPVHGFQLVRRSDHRRMLHRRDHQPARDKTGGTAEQGKVHGFRRP